ncbi:ribosomal protein L10 [Tritrichomonas foetus]|uniref:60S acidic ribosomal protein P0 n=1 Tax=Tritrichomonas foetus TaxID=1144522 RepID=A0A1J4JX05_9EUKA|nr:ribosomal protein L10 [Tritrichomonas foetus]|eukprot:OHT01805.1 ribosomal protein L10 [Tritrichomonas foetus]
MHHEKVIPQKKVDFCNRLRELFRHYHKIVLVSSENVNATQMLHIRHDLLGHAEIVFGKNSLMRRVAEELKKEVGHLEVIEPFLTRGVGLIFTNESFGKIKEVIDQHCVGSPAKVGAISPCDVTVPPMRTTLPPTQVSVLHALGIQSKIFKGTIEITSEKHLIKEGEKVGASEANLLSLLNIMPFKYTLKIEHLFDNGNLYDPAILNISDAVLGGKFAEALKNVAGLSLGIGYVNQASAPHMVGAAFKDVASIAVAVDYKLKQIEELQALLSDPEALAKMQAASAASASTGAAPAEEKKEEEEVVELAGGFDDLFG